MPQAVTPSIAQTAGAEAAPQCYHCGEACPDRTLHIEEKFFCCHGCQTVYEILSSNDLENFYLLQQNPGKSLRSKTNADYAWLDDAVAAEKLVDYQDEQRLRITLQLPQIHCTSCVWILENLHRLDEGVRFSQVNFLRQEATILIDKAKISLRQLVELLDKIGYAPSLQLDKLGQRDKHSQQDRSYLYQLGVAGFAFGNIMLLSFPEYLGLTESGFQQWFGYLNIVLSLPVLLYSARSYWKSAWLGIRSGQLNIDIPIAIGMVALFGRSVVDIVTHTGAGYLDSLAGLVFFLLIGKWFQQRTYHYLSFERDYKSYFPIAVPTFRDGAWVTLTLDRLQTGDRVRIQHGGLLPADGQITEGQGRLDYSFVTGESEPVLVQSGDKVYAGGRQMGGQLEVALLKGVSQSYLTELWNNEAFQKSADGWSSHLLGKVGKYFTGTILTIALITLVYWLVQDPSKAWPTFTAVLIIACPCALALSVPFTLGNALQLMSRLGVFVKNTGVLEILPEIDTIVFDKTGTLTSPQQQVSFEGRALDEMDKRCIASLASQSGHPVSRQIAAYWPEIGLLPVDDFEEITGQGVKGTVAGRRVCIGRAVFAGATAGQEGTWVAIGGHTLGFFKQQAVLRPGVAEMLDYWQQRHVLYLLSGDGEHARQQVEGVFEPKQMYFNQSPQDKLDFIKNLQNQGRRVLMIGDGLNDAGALRQSDVGFVVSEDVNNFSPACDVILNSDNVARLPGLMGYVKRNVRLVYAAFVMAFFYNVIGLSYAVQGLLSPLVAAIFMPLSSISIALLGVLGSYALYRRYAAEVS